MTASLIDLGRLPEIPWKNGGGSTRQLAIHPPQASLDDFAWRISCARVRGAGPFSAFPGIQRSLALLEGELLLQRQSGTMTLRAGGEASFRGQECPRSQSRAFSFSETQTLRATPATNRLRA